MFRKIIKQLFLCLFYGYFILAFPFMYAELPSLYKDIRIWLSSPSYDLSTSHMSSGKASFLSEISRDRGLDVSSLNDPTNHPTHQSSVSESSSNRLDSTGNITVGAIQNNEKIALVFSIDHPEKNKRTSPFYKDAQGITDILDMNGFDVRHYHNPTIEAIQHMTTQIRARLQKDVILLVYYIGIAHAKSDQLQLMPHINDSRYETLDNWQNLFPNPHNYAQIWIIDAFKAHAEAAASSMPFAPFAPKTMTQAASSIKPAAQTNAIMQNFALPDALSLQLTQGRLSSGSNRAINATDIKQKLSFDASNQQDPLLSTSVKTANIAGNMLIFSSSLLRDAAIYENNGYNRFSSHFIDSLQNNPQQNLSAIDLFKALASQNNNGESHLSVWKTGSLIGDVYVRTAIDHYADSNNNDNVTHGGQTTPSIKKSFNQERDAYLEKKAEEALWLEILTAYPESKQAELLYEFISRFPTSIHKNDAKDRLNILQKHLNQPTTMPPNWFIKAQPPVLVDPATNQDVDVGLLDKVEQTTDPNTVKQIQQALLDLGFYHYAIDGKMSDPTKGAIMAYQELKKWTKTSFLSPKQHAILMADSRAFLAAKNNPKKPDQPQAPSWFMTSDKDGNIQYVFGVEGDPGPDAVISDGSESLWSLLSQSNTGKGNNDKAGDGTKNSSDQSKNDGNGDAGKDKAIIHSPALEGSVALLHHSQHHNNPSDPIIEHVHEMHMLDRWSSQIPPLRHPSDIFYKAVLSSPIYKEPALFEQQIGRIIEHEWIRVGGTLPEHPEWIQVFDPNGTMGYLPKKTLHID